MISQFRPEILDAAKAHSVSPQILEAIVFVESSDKPDAFRYEFHEWQTLKTLPTEPYHALGPLAACSYGLTQTLYVTAYDFGFKAEPWKLFVPAINLEWGARILADRFRWAQGDAEKAIASYNVGKGNAKRPFSILAQAYLSKVREAQASLS